MVLVTENMHLHKMSVFIALKPQFSAGIRFLKNARFCARFWGFTNWALMVHTVVAQAVNQKRNRKHLKPLSFSRNLGFGFNGNFWGPTFNVFLIWLLFLFCLLVFFFFRCVVLFWLLLFFGCTSLLAVVVVVVVDLWLLIGWFVAFVVVVVDIAVGCLLLLLFLLFLLLLLLGLLFLLLLLLLLLLFVLVVLFLFLLVCVVFGLRNANFPPSSEVFSCSLPKPVSSKSLFLICVFLYPSSSYSCHFNPSSSCFSFF